MTQRGGQRSGVAPLLATQLLLLLRLLLARRRRCCAASGCGLFAAAFAPQHLAQLVQSAAPLLLHLLSWRQLGNCKGQRWETAKDGR